jgi:predicted NAD/FAD-dependent oxidoreductase
VQPGGEVLRGTPIRAIEWTPYGFSLAGDASGRSYTHVIAAVAPYHLGRMAAKLPRLQPVLEDIERLSYEPILTAYLGYAQPVRLPGAMVGVGGAAHFLFQRADDILTAVTSAWSAPRPVARALVARIHAEVCGIIGETPPPTWSQVIVEKRATFACRPGVRRPACETPLANFYLCGDYVASDYPATLEAAVRSGIACARLVS